MNWNNDVVINHRTEFRVKQATSSPIYSVTISKLETHSHWPCCPCLTFSLSSSCFLLRRNISAWIMPLSPRMFLTPQPFLEGMDFNFPFRNVIHNLLTHEYFWETLTSLCSLPAQGLLVEVRLLVGKCCFISQTTNHSGILVLNYLLQYKETGRQITREIYYFFVPLTREYFFKNKWLLKSFLTKTISYLGIQIYTRVWKIQMCDYITDITTKILFSLRKFWKRGRCFMFEEKHQHITHWRRR